MPEAALEWIRQEKERAWNEGYKACRKGEQQDNPYRKQKEK